MENEQESFVRYEELQQIMNTLADEMSDYMGRVKSAFNFADGHTGDTWDGLFIMGLALANLELVSTLSMITPEPYWAKAPLPKGDLNIWEDSWIVQKDLYIKKQEVLCEALMRISLKGL